MRVVAGRLKGRRLSSPEARDIRPTSDRAREAIFNIIVHGTLSDAPLEGARVIDLFAGTGALGIEALSRGAAHATFVESATPALDALSANLSALGLSNVSRIMRLDARRLPPATQPADFAFLDPPYGEALGAAALAALASGGWLSPGALCVLELGRRDSFEPPPGYALLDERSYGAARVVFLRFEIGG